VSPAKNCVPDPENRLFFPEFPMPSERRSWQSQPDAHQAAERSQRNSYGTVPAGDGDGVAEEGEMRFDASSGGCVPLQQSFTCARSRRDPLTHGLGRVSARNVTFMTKARSATPAAHRMTASSSR